MSGAKYKEIRSQIGTQNEVAALLGISRHSIMRREQSTEVSEEAAISIVELSKRHQKGRP